MAQDGKAVLEGPQPTPGDAGTGKEAAKRDQWRSPFQFFFYCLGYAVGFGNVWRFPYLCYKNGGAAFLIPYFTMLAFAGIPIFFLELSIGQYVSLGPAVLFRKLAPVMTGLGWGMVAISAFTAVYFNVILAWSLFYIVASFSAVLPWGTCDNYFNTPECYTFEEAASCRNQSLFYYNQSCLTLERYCGLAHLDPLNDTHCFDPAAPGNALPADSVVNKVSASEDFFRNRMLGVTGRTWEDMGGLRWELVGYLAAAWVVVGACLARGIRATGNIVYFTALFPYFVLFILFIRGITLEGAYRGLDFYLLQPNITRLMEVEVWSDAAIQIFYSLGICFGCLITLASYNEFNKNCMRDAFMISVANCMTSLFTGAVIFCVLGFLANELGVEVGEVATSGSGLAFIVYPAAVSLMPLPQLWSVLFFLMLITLGLGSQFTMVETVVTCVVDQYESLRQRKAVVVLVTCLVIFAMGLPMCLEGGIYMFELFFFYSAGVSVIILCLLQLFSVQGFYGFKNLMAALEEMGIRQPAPLRWYWAATWLFITPVALVMIVGFSLYYLVPASWGGYVFPYNIQVLGWFLCFASMGCVPLGALFAIITNWGNLGSIFRTSPEFCPAVIRKEKKTQDQSAPTYRNEAFDASGDGA